MLKKNIQTSLHRFVVRFSVFRLNKCRKQTSTFFSFCVQKSCTRLLKCKVKIYQAALSCLKKKLEAKRATKKPVLIHKLCKAWEPNLLLDNRANIFQNGKQKGGYAFSGKIYPHKQKKMHWSFLSMGTKVKKPHFVKSVNSFQWSIKKLKEN